MKHEVKIVRAKREHVEIAATLFDAYRQFYGQSPDVEGAREFLSERFQQDQSVIFLALKDEMGEWVPNSRWTQTQILEQLEQL